MNLNLKEVFQPKLFGLFGKGQYDGKTFTSDLIAGIIVGIIALPLAIAFGIASGVPLSRVLSQPSLQVSSSHSSEDRTSSSEVLPVRSS